MPFPSTAAALEAMQNGEIDCVFPVNLCSYDAEEMGLLTVAPIMQTEMSVMMRAEDRPKVVPGVSLTVAVPEGNSNFETFVMDDIPNWTIRHFPDMESCYRAVAEQQADAALVCNYRTTALESLGGQYKLIPLPTGETMSLSFAVRRYDHALYSILEKTSNLTPNEDMEYALVGYLHSNRKTSLMDFLEDNWEGAIFTGHRRVRRVALPAAAEAEGGTAGERPAAADRGRPRRELHQQEQLRSVTQIAYTDPLSGTKSKHAYQ